MAASRHLRRHWRASPDAQLTRVLAEAHRSVTAFAAATAQSGSLLQSWIGGRPAIEFEHYPADDVIDLRSGSQFYYHCHRHGTSEHGHLHLFWHAAASGRRRYVQAGRARWVRTAPSHLFAISLDAKGLPVGLFTVNRWVTDGHWFDAATTMAMVDRFAVRNAGGHEPSCQWLGAFIRMYRPLIERLLAQRDRRLARRASLDAALRDKRLEVLSAVAIDWAADLNALQADAAWRGLAPA